MKANFVSKDETEKAYSCDVCGKDVEEGYFVSADTDEEWEKLEDRFDDPAVVFVCELCLYEKFNPSTKIYVNESRMPECEQNLRGDW